MAIVTNMATPHLAVEFAAAAGAARNLGMQVHELNVQTVDQADAALEDASAWNADALLVLDGAGFSAGGIYARIAERGLQERLPAMYMDRLAVTEDGALMSFSPNVPASWRKSAEYVDKILRGANPADLPIEEPRQWDFLVNTKAAQAFGLTFPPDAAAQVTEWVL
jgi:putative ABC transport system substrate-binding protein